MPLSGLDDSQCLSMDAAIALEATPYVQPSTPGRSSFEAEMYLEPTAPLLPFSQLFADEGGSDMSSPMSCIRAQQNPSGSDGGTGVSRLIDTTKTKRRRLRSKQPCVAYDEPTAHSDGVLSSQQLADQKIDIYVSNDLLDEVRADTKVKEDFPTESDFYAWSVNTRNKYLYGRLRMFFSDHVFHRAYRHSLQPASTQKSALASSGSICRRQIFSALRREEKSKLADAWTHCAEAPAWLCAAVQSAYGERDPVARKRKRFGFSTLLTWVGPWLIDVSKELGSLPPDASIHQVCEALRSLPRVKEIWSRAYRHARIVVDRLRASDFAVCLEVCPQTFAQERKAQLHCHLFLRSSQNMYCSSLDEIACDGITPFLCQQLAGLTYAKQGRTSWCGYFYCVVEKIGQLFSESNKKPFTSFMVNANWVWQLLQARKITIATARDLTAQCVSGATRCLRELQTLEEEEERRAYRLLIKEATQYFAARQKPFRQYALVDQWLAQYAEMLPRYKFLVLTGPSRLGKTAFARSLAVQGMETLEVNCASGAEPDLRAYRLATHDCVLFDEVHGSQVIAQKKVIPVQLHGSRTWV